MKMILPVLDSAAAAPLYRQLYDFLKVEIQEGRLSCDAKLPSKRQLSTHLGISQNTIQAAYEQLIEEGYVTSRERSGFYVSRIDNILKLPAQGLGKQPNNSQPRAEVAFDFSYQGVDAESFPYAVWRRLSRDVIDEYDPELLRLGDPQGHGGLRANIADYLRQSRGVHCHPDQVVISAGTEFLFQTLIQLLDRSSVYGLENPGYERFNQLFTSNHAIWRPVEIDQDGMTLPGIAASAADVICITPSHQFPSGQIMPIGRRIQILNWANAASNRYIFEDDYDSEFKYSGRPIPALQGLDKSERVVYLGAFSKSLAPSLRVSYMVLPPHLVLRYRQTLPFIVCPVSVMQQKVLARFIADGHFERHLNRMRNIYRRKREALVQSFGELGSAVEISGADAGLHLLLAVRNGMSEQQLVSTALARGVRVYGISKYYLAGDQAADPPTLLIGYASMSEPAIRQAAQELRAAWFA